jgi:hypothetical protein
VYEAVVRRTSHAADKVHASDVAVAVAQVAVSSLTSTRRV